LFLLYFEHTLCLVRNPASADISRGSPRIFNRSIMGEAPKASFSTRLHLTIHKHSCVCRVWGSHSCGYEEYCIVGHNAVMLVDFQRTIVHGVMSQKPVLFILVFVKNIVS
jgi:hypothetical protein